MSSVRSIADELSSGLLAVIPTETVYGIAASPRLPAAIESIFEVKGRDRSKPLPVLCADIDAIATVVVLDQDARRVANRFWPGPLTLVLPRASGFDADLGNGRDDSVAVRVPARPLTLELLSIAGPLAVTSANRSGDAPARTVAEAQAIFGDGVRYLDGGPCDGQPSTVVSLVGEPTVLRIGALAGDEVLSELRGA